MRYTWETVIDACTKEIMKQAPKLKVRFDTHIKRKHRVREKNADLKEKAMEDHLRYQLVLMILF